MFKSVMKIGVLGLLVVVVAFTMAFSSGKLARVNCQDLIVRIHEDSPRFIDEEEIIRLVKKADEKLFEKKLNEINTEQLERALKKETAIKNIEIYRRVVGEDMDFKGKLIVEVAQRKPVVRIRNDKEAYMLDRPASSGRNSRACFGPVRRYPDSPVHSDAGSRRVQARDA